MEHVAIMKKSWHLLEKILSGEKKAESRWYQTKHVPWNKVKPGDSLWFKNSCEPIAVRAKVTKVLQFSGLNPKKSSAILKKYGKSDLGVDSLENLPVDLANYFSNKKYCLIIFFDQIRKVKPFEIDKTGFGAMSAWITIDDISSIIRKSDGEVYNS